MIRPTTKPPVNAYIKIVAKIPLRFEHPALVRSPGPDGRPLGLFFFFNGQEAPAHVEARRAAQAAAAELRSFTQSPILMSIYEWSPTKGLQADGLWIGSHVGDRDAA